VLCAVLGAALYGIFVAVLGIAEGSLTDKLELWAVGLTALGGLFVGLLAGITSVSFVRRLLKDELTEIEAEREAFVVYTDNFENLLGAVLKNELSVASFSSKKTGRELCTAPGGLMEGILGREIALSMWLEDGEGRFTVAFEHKHGHTEITDFEGINVHNSWLHDTYVHQMRKPPKTPLMWINDLRDSNDDHDDLVVFRTLGYRSVRATCAEVDGRLVRIVALSKTPDGFRRAEDIYLELLWSILKLTDQMH
jgi:hypothetical protein